MPGPYKAVVFDLDDTLFDCTGSLVAASRRRAAGALVTSGLRMTEQEAVALQEELDEAHGPHFLVFDEIGREYGLSREAVDAAYHAYNSDEVEDIETFPDVRPTLRQLRRQGVRCFLVTSGLYRRQSTKIGKLGLAEEFDQIIINDVERGVPLSECLRYLFEKYNLVPPEVLVVGDRPQEEIRVGNELGTGTARFLHGKFSEAEPRDQLETPQYYVNRIFQIPAIVRLAEMNKKPENLRIVAVGGGTGLPIVLEGCKTYCRNLTAIVTVTDSGRSSGILRDELGILPPGDARNCVVALSESGVHERRLNELFQYRFKGGLFEGMSLGNLIIAAATDMCGGFVQGIKAISKLLSIQGKVLPSTEANCQVCAELADGSLRESEVNVREVGKPPIRHVFLSPDDPLALPEAVDEILAADILVLGPGSLYTSVIANLLVPGIREAIQTSKAFKCYVCNIMTQPGQSEGLKASDHVRELLRYAGEHVLNGVLVNTELPTGEILERYRRDGAEPVLPDEALAQLPVVTKEADLVEKIEKKRPLWEKQDLLRHDPYKLGDALCRAYAGVEIYREQIL